MKLTKLFRIAPAITATLVCGGLSRAQDTNSSWLLRAPLALSSSRILDLSAARPDRADARMGSRPLASTDSQSPGGSDSAKSSDPSAASRSARPVDASLGGEHRFWDTTNDLLFAGVGASRTLDYFSTLNMRRRGRQEILLTNDVVDNHAAFAVIEAAGTGASIGVSYLFHHYGHHKLERATSIVHIGLTTTGAVRNYCLKTAHPATASPASAMIALTPGVAPVIGPR
jgi:hypothetical protein